MSRARVTLSALLAMICFLSSVPAFSAYKSDSSLNVQATAPECGSGATFQYEVMWANAANATSYQLNTGNQCRLAGTVCGISNKDCVVPCEEEACAARLAGCTYGRGSPWVQVTARDGATIYFRKRDGLYPGQRCD
ncbi:MAG: hypothetical protein AB7I04_12920 [Pseudomonadales bacterium]